LMPAKVVGITGSNGKTTLKEMIASCLSVSANTLATEGNLNNEIGVPLMLLRLHADHEYAVIEMGANNPGEIDYLACLANSDVVVITNAGPAHLQGFGSIEGVARAKGEILQTESRPQFAILNADDSYFEYWSSNASDLRVISFGTARGADLRAVAVRADASHSVFTLCTPEDEIQVDLQIAGAHNVLNACAAAAVAYALDISIQQIRNGLENVRPVSGRLRQIACANGVTVFDDSYNANPSSVIAAAEFLAGQDGTSVLVLGDMAELGEQEADLHNQVGLAAKRAGVNRLFACGELCKEAVSSFGEGGQWFESAQEVSGALTTTLQGDWNILVKGSRAMRMERVVVALENYCQKAT
jgi:UDP-N-acetylmuramoyl-tripeptide--D-alanyl-D-alanine ligase